MSAAGKSNIPYRATCNLVTSPRQNAALRFQTCSYSELIKHKRIGTSPWLGLVSNRGILDLTFAARGTKQRIKTLPGLEEGMAACSAGQPRESHKKNLVGRPHCATDVLVGKLCPRPDDIG